MSRKIKAHKIAAIRSWQARIAEIPNINPLIQSVSPEELERMSVAQLETLIAFIKAVYAYGFRNGADFARERESTEVRS